MLPDTGIDDVKKQRNAEYAKYINDPVLSSLKMEGIRLLLYNYLYYKLLPPQETHPPWLLYGNRRLRLQFKSAPDDG
jgi:hypothetical protein